MNQESGIKNITIVYEDENILSINKPPGISMHGDGKSTEKTIADWVASRYPETKDVGEPMKGQSGALIFRPGIVHRLDKETSGVVVLAKNQKTFDVLKKLFMGRMIEKEYRAVLHGIIKEKNGEINFPIGRSIKDFRLKSTLPSARGEGRAASTRYRVLETGKHFSYVAAYPQTGRTHQIRVHFKAIHHPIVCDHLYAPKRPCPPELGRLALHAYALTIPTPERIVRLEAPIPNDMQAFIQKNFTHCD